MTDFHHREQLIIAVRDHPEIWDTQNEKHNDKRSLITAWNDISNQLNASEDDLKSKWRNIRDYYRKEVKRIRKLKASGVSRVKSSWPHFVTLDFLDACFSNDLGESNFSLEDDPFLEIIESVDEDTNLYLDRTRSKSSTGNPDQDSESEASVDTPTLTGRASSSSKRASKRSHSSDYKDKMLELEARKIAILEKEVTDDEDLLFFKSLLKDFKSLPRDRRMYLKLKYQEMLYEEVKTQKQN